VADRIITLEMSKQASVGESQSRVTFERFRNELFYGLIKEDKWMQKQHKEKPHLLLSESLLVLEQQKK